MHFVVELDVPGAPRSVCGTRPKSVADLIHIHIHGPAANRAGVIRCGNSQIEIGVVNRDILVSLDQNRLDPCCDAAANRDIAVNSGVFVDPGASVIHIEASRAGVGNHEIGALKFDTVRSPWQHSRSPNFCRAIQFHIIHRSAIDESSGLLRTGGEQRPGHGMDALAGKQLIAAVHRNTHKDGRDILEIGGRHGFGGAHHHIEETVPHRHIGKGLIVQG